MNRRRLLAVSVAGFAACSGCLGESDDSGSNDGDEWDEECSGAFRPEPDEPDSDDAVSPFEYPDRPESDSDEALLEYVETYERAMVGNDLIERHGDALKGYGLGVIDSELVDREPVSVVRLTYEISDEIQSGVSDAIDAGLSDEKSVKYAVTSTGIRQAGGDDSEPPDPRESGQWVACFGSEQ